MKILVLGAGGMAGHTVSLWLTERGYDVTGFCRTGSPVCRCIRGDARDTAALDRLLASADWTHIVNCAGILNAACDRDASSAVAVNSLLPLRLHAHCRESGAHLVHISTDYVFSGSRGSYRTADLPDGTTLYARSKALGEAYGPNACCLRTSFVGPDLRPDGPGLFNWFMQAEQDLCGFVNAAWTGLASTTLAALIEQCILHDTEGLYQAVPAESISKYELLCLFSRVFREGSIRIKMDTSPRTSPTLVPDALPFPFEIPAYETMLRQMKDWILRHRGLYPHYPFSEEKS